MMITFESLLGRRSGDLDSAAKLLVPNRDGLSSAAKRPKNEAHDASRGYEWGKASQARRGERNEAVRSSSD